MSTSSTAPNAMSANIFVLFRTFGYCTRVQYPEVTALPADVDGLVWDGSPCAALWRRSHQAVRITKSSVCGVASSSRCRRGVHGNSSGRPSLPKYQLLQPVTHTVCGIAAFMLSL